MQQVLALHGIGATRAQKIHACLGTHGRFESLADLRRIGLSAKQIETIATSNSALMLAQR